MFFQERDPELVRFQDFLKTVKTFIYPKLSVPSYKANDAHKFAALSSVDLFATEQMFNEKVKDKPQYLQEKDENGATPLHVAAFCSQNAPKAWALLLEQASQANFDFTSVDSAGRTILHLLAQTADSSQIEEFLSIAKNVNLEAEDHNGLTPLQTALVRQNFAAVEELVRQGASIDNKGGLPYSPKEYLQNALTYSQSLAETASNDHDKERWLRNVNMVQEKLSNLQQAWDDSHQLHA